MRRWDIYLHPSLQGALQPLLNRAATAAAGRLTVSQRLELPACAGRPLLAVERLGCCLAACKPGCAKRYAFAMIGFVEVLRRDCAQSLAAISKHLRTVGLSPFAFLLGVTGVALSFSQGIAWHLRIATYNNLVLSIGKFQQ